MAGSSVKIVIIAFSMNLGIAIAKYIGFLLTGSAAMLAESVHSLADTSNQVFLYMGIRGSKREASRTHQFGYGMEQYVFSFLVAILIFALGGAYSLYEGIHKLLHPSTELADPLINIIILATGMVLEGYSSWIATKEFRKVKGSMGFFEYLRKTKDQVLVTVLFEDFAALIGLFVAMVGIILYMITNNVIWDSVATIAIGVLLMILAVFLYREAKSLLVGEAASADEQEKIEAAFNDHEGVEDLKELLTMHLSANQILVNAHVKFRSGLTLEEVEDIIDEIEDKIIEGVPDVFKIFIETHQRDAVEPLQKDVAGKKKDKGKRKTTLSQPKRDKRPNKVVNENQASSEELTEGSEGEIENKQKVDGADEVLGDSEANSGSESSPDLPVDGNDGEK